MYRRLAEVRTDVDVDQIRDELDDRYGEPPLEVASLLLVARFRARARQASLTEITIAGRNVRFASVDLPESRVVRLNRVFPKSIYKQQVGALLVPRPHVEGAGARPIDGVALLEWARTVIDAVIDPKS
jgi:transcription-repair coupling factor (superfamily II helicase)